MENIKKICDTYYITQTELAKRLNIPLRTVQDWYGGRRNPPEYVVELIAYRVQHDPIFRKEKEV